MKLQSDPIKVLGSELNTDLPMPGPATGEPLDPFANTKFKIHCKLPENFKNIGNFTSYQFNF